MMSRQSLGLRLASTIFGVTLESKVAGIYSGTIDDRNMLFHHKYFDEATASRGLVGTWWVKVKSIEDMPRVIEAINRAFANTSAEVRAETERAFQLSFISMLGNVKFLVHSISTIVVITLLLVTASTMSIRSIRRCAITSVPRRETNRSGAFSRSKFSPT